MSKILIVNKNGETIGDVERDGFMDVFYRFKLDLHRDSVFEKTEDEITKSQLKGIIKMLANDLKIDLSEKAES